MRQPMVRSNLFPCLLLTALLLCLPICVGSAQQSELNKPPEGFVALFNGKDLTGWKGLVGNPETRAKMSPEELARAQAKADEQMRAHWKVVNGVLVFDGKGKNICTAKDYGDFELLVDWKIEPGGDSGIYLRGTPQVQIWDASQHPEGSGGLYNNKKGPNKPLKCADKPVGQWNTFRIKMIGDRVTVYLNGELVVDNVVMENYWDRSKPIYPTGPIELQSHGSRLYFRNIFIREIPRRGEWRALFNGRDLSGWEQVGGRPGSWTVENGILVCKGGGGGWLSTTRQFADFELDLQFRLPPGGNSGVFLRAPRRGNPAYVGMEIQVLDDYAPGYANLRPTQYAGSIYDVVPAWPAVAKKSDPALWSKRATKKAGEWQRMTILCHGRKVRVTLNGKVVVDANLDDYPDKVKRHPGLKRTKGYIGLQNHGSRLEYRDIRIREIRH